MKCGFMGSFNKINNHRECDYNREFGLECEFDDDIYNKVSVEIENILGKKDTYSVQDAYRYFHKTFYAYQIDYRSFYNYYGTERALPASTFGKPTISDDYDIEQLSDPSGAFYSYLKNGQFTDEQALTLVIDQNNDCLRKKYTITNENCKENIILVIGSFDGTNINSMKVLLGEELLKEVEYSLEFFRRHC